MCFIDPRGTWGKMWYSQYRSDCSLSDAPVSAHNALSCVYCLQLVTAMAMRRHATTTTCFVCPFAIIVQTAPRVIDVRHVYRALPWLHAMIPWEPTPALPHRMLGSYVKVRCRGKICYTPLVSMSSKYCNMASKSRCLWPCKPGVQTMLLFKLCFYSN